MEKYREKANEIKLYLASFFENHKVETILLGAALLIMASSIANYVTKSKKIISQEIIFQEPKNIERTNEENLYVEVSGAVDKPDTYALRPGTRLKEAIKQAGGLADSADRDFFARNFNLARILNDQDKIYVPSTQELQYGIVKENAHTIEYIAPQNLLTAHYSTTVGKVNINSASTDELDSLTGVGLTTAQKIIANRPYTAINDLVAKKVISAKLLSNLSDQIEL